MANVIGAAVILLTVVRRLRSCLAALTLMGLVPFATSSAHLAYAAEPLKQQKFSIDLGSYRGYWRLETAAGKEISHDECFAQRVCRETFKGLPEGDYVLILSDEPQSAPIAFKVKPGAVPGPVIVTSGANLAGADGTTLRLKDLRRVVIDTNGFRGAWSLDNWKGAEATGYFKRDGSEQAIELFPETTYTLNIGSFSAERFQVGRNNRIVLIDDSGAVRVATDAVNRLVLQTIDAAFYPVPGPDTARWTIEGVTPPDAGLVLTGPRILRLVQGAKYKLAEPSSGEEAVAGSFTSGKACNMMLQNVTLAKLVISVVPIAASCNAGTSTAAPQ